MLTDFDFDDRDTHIHLRKISERHGGREFKKGGIERVTHGGAKTFSPIVSMRSGRRSVSACPIALAS